MKIAILTLPLHINYGGILQAYALQTVLERMGHEVEVINPPTFYRSLPLWKKPVVYVKRLIDKYYYHRISTIFLEEQNRAVYQNIHPFFKRYIHIREVEKIGEIKETDYDAFVVGSDQIWRPLYFEGDIENAYLRFAKDWHIRRIAYAPSFGTDSWEYSAEQTQQCAALLAQFDAVSVREVSAVGLVKEKFGRDASWVLDPTMLLAMDDYKQLFQSSHAPLSKGNMMVYVLDANDFAEKLVQHCAEKYQLTPFYNNAVGITDVTSSLEQKIQPPVEKWLRAFYDAELVITDSFHACVFSIIFNKPFIVVDNVERGLSRIESLLELINQPYRKIRATGDDLLQIDPRLLVEPNVEEVIASKRMESEQFLLKGLCEENVK